MKVRINYTVEVGDFYRRAIRHFYGRPGLATRAEVREWLRRHGEAQDDSLVYDLAQAIERGEVEEPLRGAS